MDCLFGEGLAETRSGASRSAEKTIAQVGVVKEDEED